MRKPTFAELHRRMSELSTASIKVGVLDSAGTTADGTPLVEIAAVHEYGTSESSAIHIPQRSFIRSTFKRTASERTKITASLIKKVTNDHYMTVQRALGLYGNWAVARVKETIVKRLTTGPESQALKPATIAAKGSSTPLIDTAQLKNSISYEIIEAKK